MFSSMTNWFGTTKEKDEIVNEEGNKNQEESEVEIRRETTQSEQEKV
jgi:hypothetical protein